VYCIGLMSGTSVDGIDAAFVEITGSGFDLQVYLLQGETYPYSSQLRDQILAVCAGHPISMIEFADLDDAIASEFATAAQKIQAGYPNAEIIGSHGQTVFHRPPTHNMGYTLQLGRGALIAHLTGIPTVSNFRVADIAAGGQGAPLVSKIDVCLLTHPTLHRCIQNIGGIGNVTYLPPRNTPNWDLVCGWDTGPGNVLIDLAVQKLSQGKQTYDADGQEARLGIPCEELVQEWLNHEYFQLPPPKSTGRELFSPSYLENCWKSAQSYHLSSFDWLATLTEFTVASIVDNYIKFLPQMPDEVLVCGGGSQNSYLKERLQSRLGEKSQVLTTDDGGLNSNFKEAIAFAVLAYWRLHQFPGNFPSVTGAKQDMLLGEIYLPVI
jgi:anhydro-N-acetylmuramic acid kinase